MSGTKYAQYMAALTAFNHPRFMGTADYWTRALFDELGMKGVSQNFTSIYLVSVFVVCVDPALIIESTKEIPGSWGNNKKKVQKAFTTAVKTAKPKDIKYPKTLNPIQTSFPVDFKLIYCLSTRYG